MNAGPQTNTRNLQLFNRVSTMNKNVFFAAVLLGTSAAPAVFAADLMEVYERAQRHDAQFRAETATYHAEQQQVPQSRAALLPQINASARSTESTNETIQSDFCEIDPSSCQLGAETESEQLTWSVELTQSIYNHEYWARLQQANDRAAQAEAEYQAARQSLILRTAEAYFNVLAALDNVAFAEAETEAVAQQLEQAQQRFEVGLIAITDVKEAQAQYDQAQASEIQARNELATSREALFRLTNTDPDELDPLQEKLPLLPPDPEDKQQWVERALDENLSLRAARFAQEAADEEISAQRSGHYPSLELFANRQFSDSEGENFGDSSEQESTTVGIQLRVPIFSGGGTSARVKEAIYRHDATRDQLESTRRQVVQQTRDAYQNTLADISRVKALRQALESAQAAYEATEAGFEVGTRNSVEVLLSLRNTFAAERDYAQTRYDYLLNTLRLKQAAGNLTAGDLRTINQWLQ